MMDHLLKGTDPKFRKLLGKRVKFIYEGEVHVGILQFAGINKFIHNEFQITISRRPFWPADPSTLEEVIDNKSIIKR